MLQNKDYTKQILQSIRDNDWENLLEQKKESNLFKPKEIGSDVLTKQNQMSQKMKHIENVGIDRYLEDLSMTYTAETKPEKPIYTSVVFDPSSPPTDDELTWYLPYKSTRAQKQFCKNKNCYCQLINNLIEGPYCKGSNGKENLNRVFESDLSAWNSKHEKEMDTHDILALAAVGALFIPMVGPAISLGLDLLDSSMYFVEGNNYRGGLGLAFSIIPGHQLAKHIPAYKKLTETGMNKLLNKLKIGAKSYTTTELEALEQFKNSKNKIQNLINKDLYTASVKKLVQKIKPRDLLAGLYKFMRKNPKKYNLSKIVLQIGGITYTYDKIAEIFGWKENTQENKNLSSKIENELDEETTEGFVNKVFSEGDTTDDVVEFVRYMEEGISNQKKMNNNLQNENIIKHQLLLMKYNSKNTLTENLLLVENVANLWTKIKNLFDMDAAKNFLKNEIKGQYQLKWNNILNKLKTASNSVTKEEFEFFMKSLNTKELTKKIFENKLIIDQLKYNRIINYGVTNIKDFAELEMAKNSIKNILKKRLKPIYGSSEYANDIIEEYSRLFYNDLKSQISKQNPKLFKKLIQQETSQFGETVLKKDLFNIARWDGKFLELSDAEIDLLRRKGDKTLLGQLVSRFKTTSSEIDRLQKLAYKYTTEKNDIVKGEIANELKKGVEKLIELSDIVGFKQFLTNLQSSTIVSTQEKNLIKQLDEKVFGGENNPLKSLAAMTEVLVEKTTADKIKNTLSLIWIAFKDSFDFLLSMGFKFSPSFTFKNGKPRINWKLTDEELKKLAGESGEKVWFNIFSTASKRGFPKIKNRAYEDIIKKYGSLNSARAVYSMTLAFKIAKAGSALALIETVFEWFVTNFQDENVQACKNAIKKISPTGNVKITDQNFPAECNGGWFFKVAWDFATTSEGMYREDQNQWIEFFENFKTDWKFKFSVILPFGHIFHALYQLFNLGNYRNRKDLMDSLNKNLNKYQNELADLEQKAYSNISESESIEELEKFSNDETLPKEVREAVKKRLDEIKNKSKNVTTTSDDSWGDEFKVKK